MRASDVSAKTVGFQDADKNDQDMELSDSVPLYSSELSMLLKLLSDMLLFALLLTILLKRFLHIFLIPFI
jgi:hypothetical protein